MAATRTQRVTRSAPLHAVDQARTRGQGSAGVPQVLGEEFVRLAQRELHASEIGVAQAVLDGVDVWAAGHDPESLPTLAVALACVLPAGPLLFISPEAELLRSRQVRFGARAHTVLIDRAAEPFSEKIGSSGVGGRVLWCTLESLRDPTIRKRLASLAPTAIFVESAHAASPLAYEVRPSLALVPGLRALCGQPPLVAFTRAASVAVQADATDRLGLVAPHVERAPSLCAVRFTVTAAEGQVASGAALVDWVERLPRPTIVLCATPQQADIAFATLTAAQVPVHRYHGAMSAAERATEVLHFTLPGRRAVMVATSAFGPASGLAGVDAGDSATPEGLGLGYCKQKARSLVHLCAPFSLEQYALELSVAGGVQGTESVLFFEPKEFASHLELLERLRSNAFELESLGAVLGAAVGPSDPATLERASGLGPKAVRRSVRLLEDAGVVQATAGGVVKIVSKETLLQVTTLLAAGLVQMREADVERLGAVYDFLTSDQCRHATFATYVGDVGARPCGVCDICARSEEPKRSGARPRVSGEGRRPSARAWSVSSPAAEQLAVAEPGPRRSQSFVP